MNIAATVAANPTLGKKALRSGVLKGVRSMVQSKGAFASGVATVGKKAASMAISAIPVPGVSNVLGPAFDEFAKVMKQKMHQYNLDKAPTLKQAVKFELKEIGGAVEAFDAKRWKIDHAIKQFNKAVAEIKTDQSTPPCDGWVRVWAKYYYIGARVLKLRADIEATRAILDLTDKWLVEVEGDVGAVHAQAKAQYDKDIEFLKKDESFHATCSAEKCMYKPGSWTAKATVPTSDASKFFIKVVSTVVGTYANLDTGGGIYDTAGDSIGD